MALPVLLMLLFFAVNVQFFNFARTTQEVVTDASALASAQSVVDDTMLDGTGANIVALEAKAVLKAQEYADLNPIRPVPITYAAGDIVFTTIKNPYQDTLLLIDSITVTSQRTGANKNPVPIFGRRLFTFSAVDSTAKSKAVLDRHVAGLRPVYAQNIPLAPIALLQADWAAQVEAAYTQPPSSYIVTLGGANASFLKIGTIDEAGLAAQLANGISPAQLGGAPFNGQFVPDATNGLSVLAFSPATPKDFKTALLGVVGKQIAWPLFDSLDGNALVVRLVAAKLTAVSDNAMNFDNLDITLQPTFLSGPSVVTESTRSVNLYLCRVHLTN